MNSLCMVYITASNKDEAAKIGKEMVLSRLAACANVFDGMNSFYIWKGKQDESQEAVLILKTKTVLFEEIEKAVKEMHSYTCPCILTLPIERISTEYEQWINENTL